LAGDEEEASAARKVHHPGDLVGMPETTDRKSGWWPW